MAIRGGGGHLYRKILVTYVLKKHREIGREHRENAGNLILTRTWPPCYKREAVSLCYISYFLCSIGTDCLVYNVVSYV